MSEKQADGAELIRAERERQILSEGFSPEHDREWQDGELPNAAIAYLMADKVDEDHYAKNRHYLGSTALTWWPWELRWWKPRSRLENLVRAGALIAAEIDRILREEKQNEIDPDK